MMWGRRGDPNTSEATTPNDILKRVRRIQLQTSHRVDELLVGGWHSAFKGRGIEFEEVRPYQIGDDVRAIDWNVTARADSPFVKLFREERELAVMLLVDASRSIDFGTQHQTKRELAIDASATIAMSAIKNNDKVGMTLFTDRIEKHIPPRQGARHVLRFIRELLYQQPEGTRTDPLALLEHLGRTVHRRSVVFWLGDFVMNDPERKIEKAMRVFGRRHDVIPVVLTDERESVMPSVGLVRLRDSESGRQISIDTSSVRVRRRYAELAAIRNQQRDALFARLKWRPLVLKTGEDIAEPLRRYFHFRELHSR
ncbi:DUF58 domain-containing protein [Neorhodopirellula pilleata]|uniref:DUF58 domain-containing protein n=1 Tax=Neorhodopirellula pilleata TaxID=2714738 RepID=A0A5C6AFR2_9BACT|nr:DUF58 domain-containing protein [Neorhodopirellula pilleata]TWT98872.1 hypothetical protein Pla100_20380 [Neorhodopirellula pilleata]